MSNRLCSLLIVDDEADIQSSLADLLKKDFDIVAASTSEEARHWFERRDIDLILADQLLAGSSGVELLEWVRQRSPQTIRLLMTGIADLETTIKAINRGEIFRIVIKPWRTDELLSILDRAAQFFRLARSNEELLDELRRSNSELEDRVRGRTRELEEAVRQLQQRNAMLEKLSLTDPLTGLPNRRAMDRVVEAELRRRSRRQSPLALGLIDADHFKQINSWFLLPGGDQMLICLAQTLATTVRLSDTVGRIGGEEFLVVAPETDLQGTSVLAERLRSAVEISSATYQGQTIHTTISAGFAVAEPGTSATYDSLNQVAAEALGEAKNAGRNRFVLRPL